MSDPSDQLPNLLMKMAGHGLQQSSARLSLLRLQRDEITATVRTVPKSPIPKNYPKIPPIELSLNRTRYLVGVLMALNFDNEARRVLDQHNIDVMLHVDSVRLLFTDADGKNHIKTYRPIPGVGFALQTFFDGVLDSKLLPDRVRRPANMPQTVVEVVVKMQSVGEGESTESLAAAVHVPAKSEPEAGKTKKYTIKSDK